MNISDIIRLGQNSRSSKVNQIDFIFFQKISPYFTKVFLFFNFTPNFITTLGMLLIFLSSILVITDNKTNIFLASIFAMLYLVFDYSDGEVARIKKQQSMSGTYLDFVLDYFVYTFILGSISILYLKYNPSLYSYAGVVFGLSSTLLRGIINLMISHVIITETLRINNRVQNNNDKKFYVSLFQSKQIIDKEEKKITSASLLKKIIKLLASAFHGNQIIYMFFLISFIELFFNGWYFNGYFFSPLFIYVLLIFLLNPIIVFIKVFQIISLKQVERQYKKFHDNKSKYSSKDGGHLK